jgi:hypothetical protein
VHGADVVLDRQRGRLVPVGVGHAGHERGDVVVAALRRQRGHQRAGDALDRLGVRSQRLRQLVDADVQVAVSALDQTIGVERDPGARRSSLRGLRRSVRTAP